MTLDKLRTKADLWLKLHGVATFGDAKELYCAECCPYFYECPSGKDYTKEGVIRYKDACIKWLDDVGFGG